MENIEKYVIKSLITSPKTDKEIGFNSALITLLKAMSEGTPLHLQEVEMANNPDPNPDIPLNDTEKLLRSAFKKILGNTELFRETNLSDLNMIIADIPGNKLLAVKNLKVLCGLGLKEAKDIVDTFDHYRVARL